MFTILHISAMYRFNMDFLSLQPNFHGNTSEGVIMRVYIYIKHKTTVHAAYKHVHYDYSTLKTIESLLGSFICMMSLVCMNKEIVYIM